ncbi:hypothetical protein BJ878DRAFT_531300 [Calycina marina]|uniref:Uncharacterized protein n=1 Tax=Calycina marina TaxID=1763456 RepID=A0A9P7ZD53_9HELO|nr:hypothetical protein BJ878DRAFT_531300 [Calycina marina]
MNIIGAEDDEEAINKAFQDWRREHTAELRQNSRFSLPWHVRLPFATSMSFIVGMGLGMSHGSQAAGLRFRAENAHRLPTTPTGWYLYHKSKNYQRAFGGVIEGFRMGAKVSIWTAGFFSIEEMYDRYRGRKDFANTVLASLTVAGAFSAWNQFPITTAARTAKSGLAIGLVYGLAQDAVGLAKGRVPHYLKWTGIGRRKHEDIAQKKNAMSS